MDTIRLIHNLPRSGGTIISKCLGAQKNVILLSEIHPEAFLISKKMGVHSSSFDPIFQSQTWNNLFEKDEYKKISNSNFSPQLILFLPLTCAQPVIPGLTICLFL